ncbi:MAG: UDP-N-acetylmuramoyl-L-alanyl-D-glutamate--2,6-diaminopimelate ligase [Phenylobacterium sp.]|jgi:UDP-N-acetylmuramoyl-L-alanyl-D-glutamate--2,6-diaminopimelate ligase
MGDMLMDHSDDWDENLDASAMGQAMKPLQPWLEAGQIEVSNTIANLITQIWAADIRMDSRLVCPGDVFVAIKGVDSNGVNYIDSAIQQGAVAVLVDAVDVVDIEKAHQQMAANVGVALIAIDQLWDKFPSLLNHWYTEAAQTKLIGITGTNGKTTISQLIAQLAQQNQQQVAVIGTLGIGRLGALEPQENTTPGIADNYRLLNQFVQDGCEYVAMEVSSQGLAQGRVSGLDFGCTVFTNLTQDHLDYHGDLASYTNAKKALFEQNPTASTILNIDDPVALSWFKQWHGQRNMIAVGTYDQAFTEGALAGQHVMFTDAQYTSTGLVFNLISSWGNRHIESPLYGQFNLNNLVTALAALLSYGLPLDKLVDSVEHLQAVCGRMEQFGHDEKGLVAVVDYAHTPDALAQALQALRRHTDGQLWCIFGCGGNRDKTKRPLMGQIAEQYADWVIVTNDNPRHELAQDIAADIAAGFAQRSSVTVELDRKKAIAQTLKQAKKGDVILIAGKGHETYQVFGDEVVDYDERAYVSQCIQELSV